MSLDEQQLKQAREKTDVASVLRIWQEGTDTWNETLTIADAMLDIANDLVNGGRLQPTANLLAELAGDLTTSTGPLRDERQRFGFPGFPHQVYIAMATHLYIGRHQTAMPRLTAFEKGIPTSKSLTYQVQDWSYLGWSLCLGGCTDEGKEKFRKAITLGLSLTPASHACAALVTVAYVLTDAGLRNEAMGVLDSATGTTSKMREAVFSDRLGTIVSPAEHEAIARSWSQELVVEIERAKGNMASVDRASDIFLGYLLDERNKGGLRSAIESKDYPAIIECVRTSIQNESNFDKVLTSSAATAALFQANKASGGDVQ